MRRRHFNQQLLSATLLPFSTGLLPQTPHGNGRSRWVGWAKKLATPVFKTQANGGLANGMPIEQPRKDYGDRTPFAPLEAFARTLLGFSAWFGLEGDLPEKEKAERDYLLGLAQKGLEAGVNNIIPGNRTPGSPQFVFDKGEQPLVDTAFLAQALLRAPNALWKPLNERTQKYLIAALHQVRRVTPYDNNWLLFSCLVETALEVFAGEGNREMVLKHLNRFETFYRGDGLYADGPAFHQDYYNSFVIYPALLDVYANLPAGWVPEISNERLLKRAQRYGQILERSVGANGSLPPVGRSVAYRAGALHALAHLAWRGQLPTGLPSAQVRGALEAAQHWTLDTKGTFSKEGWLQIGLHGHQPGLAEPYINTGSLYLCSTALLPLGLPPTDAFWQGPAVLHTALQVERGLPVLADAALKE